MQHARAAIILIAVLGGSPAFAQDTRPVAGTWGVEAGTFSQASLLRFRSERTAWVLGAFASFRHETEETQEPLIAPTSTTEDRVAVSLRLGLRRYRDSGERIRPFTTLSAVVGYDSYTFGDGIQAGGAGELGAAYFFSPHVSLGGSGELTAMYHRFSRDGAFPSDRRGFSLNFSGVRLLGAVYF